MAAHARDGTEDDVVSGPGGSATDDWSQPAPCLVSQPSLMALFDSLPVGRPGGPHRALRRTIRTRLTGCERDLRVRAHNAVPCLAMMTWLAPARLMLPDSLGMRDTFFSAMAATPRLACARSAYGFGRSAHPNNAHVDHAPHRVAMSPAQHAATGHAPDDAAGVPAVARVTATRSITRKTPAPLTSPNVALKPPAGTGVRWRMLQPISIHVRLPIARRLSRDPPWTSAE